MQHSRPSVGDPTPVAPSIDALPRRTVVLGLAVLLAGCASPPRRHGAGVRVDQRPGQFKIVPDDYHVPYAGTAQDGRKFFLSDEFFGPGGAAYVGLFMWKADGVFDDLRVDKVNRPQGLPPGQAMSAGAKELIHARLAELGHYTVEPITVQPFLKKVDGVDFGWHVGRYDDGTYYINIEPGDFICYYAPWDGLDYDT